MARLTREIPSCRPLRLVAALGTTILSLCLSVQGAAAEDCAGGDDHGTSSGFACGGADTYGDSSVALGVAATTGSPTLASDNDTAVGFAASAIGQSLAVGSAAKAGFESQIDPSRYHTAIGTGSEAGQNINGLELATAVGYVAKANASYATAIGAGAEANYTAAMAIGQGVKATREYQVAIGDGQSSYTLAGIASQASTDAQGEVTYLVTTDANGNLAASTFDAAALATLPAAVAANTTAISTLNGTVSGHTVTIANHEARITSNTQTLASHTLQIDDLDERVTGNSASITQLDGRVGALETGFQDLGNQISETRSEARAGTALALATAGLRYDDRAGKFSVAGGFGHFKGQSGLALGLGYNPSDAFRLNGALSATTNNGDIGVSVGASWTLN